MEPKDMKQKKISCNGVNIVCHYNNNEEGWPCVIMVNGLPFSWFNQNMIDEIEGELHEIELEEKKERELSIAEQRGDELNRNN